MPSILLQVIINGHQFSTSLFWAVSMDNGWSDKGKNHQTSKVWAFWAMYVGCPDKIHLC